MVTQPRSNERAVREQVERKFDLQRVLDDEQVDDDIDQAIDNRNKVLLAMVADNASYRQALKKLAHKLIEVAHKEGYPDARITGLYFSEDTGNWILYVRPGPPNVNSFEMVAFDVQGSEGMPTSEIVKILRADFMDGYEPSE